MCRMYILWESYKKDDKYNKMIDKHYNNYFDKNILSRGLCKIYSENINFIKELHYYNITDIKENQYDNQLKYIINHVRIPFDKKATSIIKNNIHPFIYKNRYICMHNGKIEFKKLLSPDEKKKIKGTTDSERFFNLLLQIKDDNKLENIYEGIKEIYKYIKKDSLLNIIILDKKEDIVMAYRGIMKHTDLPPLYIYKYGIANIRSNDDYTILSYDALFIRKNAENKIYKNYVKKI